MKACCFQCWISGPAANRQCQFLDGGVDVFNPFHLFLNQSPGSCQVKISLLNTFCLQAVPLQDYTCSGKTAILWGQYIADLLTFYVTARFGSPRCSISKVLQYATLAIGCIRKGLLKQVISVFYAFSHAEGVDKIKLGFECPLQLAVINLEIDIGRHPRWLNWT